MDPPAPNSAWRETAETIRSVVTAVLVVLVLRVVFFQPFTIPSSSMEPGLVTGDYIVVSKFAYGWSRASLPFNPPLFHGRLFGRSPQRGDVVVFQLAAEPRKTLIKRVIGLPDDRIQVRGGLVFVNGRPIPAAGGGPGQDRDSPGQPVTEILERKANGQRYVAFDRGPGREGDDTDVYRVPADHYFMMGDNRDNSLDSRWPAGYGVGYVPAEQIVGKAQIVLVSWKPGASLFKPWTWPRLEAGRFFKPIV